MDPFSIATGVAGLISLGLAVSGGLIQYCRDYKSQDTDLVKLTQHAQDLESLLSLIENRNTGPQSPSRDITTSLQNCQDACDACLRDFKRMNAKYASSKHGQTFKGRGRELLHNLKYPFDKGRFDDCRSQLQEFNARLLGHLQLANLDLTRDIRCTMILEFAQVTTAVDSAARQLQSSISDVNSAVTSTIRDGVGQLEYSFQRSLQKTESSMVSAIAHQLDQVIQTLQNQSKAQATSTSAENRIALDLYSMNDTRQDRSATRTPSSVMFGRAVLCDCPKAQHGYSSTRHRKDCPYSFTNKKKRTFSMSFQAFRRQVIWTWQVEYSPLAWARSWQIQRNLTLRATVPYDAPAFTIMSGISFMLHSRMAITIQEMKSTLQDYLVELQQIFTNGRGWPTDVNESGENLMHFFIRSMYLFLDSSNSTKDEELSTIFLQFASALVLMGVPINEVDKYGQTPLRTAITPVIPFKNTTSVTRTYIANMLINMEATTLESYKPDDIINVLSLNNTNIYDSFSCTEFLYEVLLRSGSSFVRLRADPSLIYERTRDGQTALHLAANWPEGISTLIKSVGLTIKSIINKEDAYGHAALLYAIMLDESDSVQLLLDAGATITGQIIGCLGVIGDERRRVVQIVITYLAQRQTGLLKLALQNLPVEIINKLRLREDEVLDLDDKALDVAKALGRRQVPIPVIYHIPEISPVYHRLAYTPFMARELFDAGFHRTDTKIAGHTPLMTLPFHYTNFASCLEVVCWFEDHGADLHTPIPIPGRFNFVSNPQGLARVYPTMHKVFYNLGRASFFSGNMNMNLSTEVRYRFVKLLQDEYADSCLCYCSLGGCTSASKYARGLYDSCGSYIHIAESDVLRIFERRMISYDQCTVVLDLIRVMTFQRLGMKHTCCNYRRFNSLQNLVEQGLLALMEPAEVEEIREEDRYLAEQLDSLMKEFEAKLREMGVPLNRFIEEYWWPRMEEVKKERDELSAGVFHAIKEIGVVLEES
ncbi:hypothetical protein F5Y00DRAFT_271922 [Daldinia vernicosa]|uniref:uncharacterized protein n=1 Tax=Daldinia vernicosa TaxID=114800 RepID=UPI002008D3BA|nr:uncharacterized protein F5Y00DRAFT_271922 [Daldinia vernicosa]KAI0846645.1 hypothetical protein F5Y00DRAFT_271922 [Daldinia vernicosa]